MTVIEQTPPAPLGRAAPLPPLPPLDHIRRQVTTRLATIQSHALPALALRRRCLERLWRHDASDAVPVFAATNESFAAHPAGADRLAGVLADQHVLEAEAIALGELSAALDRYEAGGSSLLADVDAPPANASAHVPPSSSSDMKPITEETFSRFLRDYVLEVREEIWSARQVGAREQWEKLETEYAELQRRIRARSAGMRALARAVCGESLSRSA